LTFSRKFKIPDFDESKKFSKTHLQKPFFVFSSQGRLASKFAKKQIKLMRIRIQNPECLTIYNDLPLPTSFEVGWRGGGGGGNPPAFLLEQFNVPFLYYCNRLSRRSSQQLLRQDQLLRLSVPPGPSSGCCTRTKILLRIISPGRNITAAAEGGTSLFLTEADEPLQSKSWLLSKGPGTPRGCPPGIKSRPVNPIRRTPFCSV
jgi:hypothetical protein